MGDVKKQNQNKFCDQVFTIAFPNEVPPPIVVLGEDDESETPCDFEEAVAATGFGAFNLLLILAVLPSGFANIFDTTTMSYVVPASECDLELTLFQKGILNAIGYLGMMTSAFMWGYLADTRGRRTIMMYGYLGDAICVIIASTSQNFYFLTTFRFLSGFMVSGPFAISMTYLAEFHGTKYRSKAMLWAGIFPALGSVTLPILAWGIIPQTWSFSLLDGAFVYNSWRIFILFCSLPAIIATLTLLSFPESPKFLMSQGRNDEALKIFQRMYSMNTKNPPETFPIKILCQEGQRKQIERSASRRNRSIWSKTKSGLAQFKPLFKKPYLYQFLLIIIIELGSMLSVNTLRLWMPQLFTFMENFDFQNRDPNLGAPTLCDMISVPNSLNSSNSSADNDYLNSTIKATCVVAPIKDAVYINSIIIAGTSVLFGSLAGTFVNLFGKKTLLLSSYLITATCAFSLNWSPNSDITLTIFAIYTSVGQVTIFTIVSVIVDLIPTSLRTTAVSLTLCVGRSGAILGNLLFPILLDAGCMVPFAFVGGFIVLCFVLSIFIPKPPAKLM